MNRSAFDDSVTAELKKISGVILPVYETKTQTTSANGVQYMVDCYKYKAMNEHVDNDLARAIILEKEKIGGSHLIAVIDTDAITQRRELRDLIGVLIENDVNAIRLIANEESELNPESVAVVAMVIKDHNVGLIIPHDNNQAKNTILVKNILGETYVTNSNLFNIDDNGAFLSVVENTSMMPPQNITPERLGL